MSDYCFECWEEENDKQLDTHFRKHLVPPAPVQLHLFCHEMYSVHANTSGMAMGSWEDEVVRVMAPVCCSLCQWWLRGSPVSHSPLGVFLPCCGSLVPTVLQGCPCPSVGHPWLLSLRGVPVLLWFAHSPSSLGTSLLPFGLACPIPTKCASSPSHLPLS